MRNGLLALVIVVCAVPAATAQNSPDSRFSVGVTGGLGTGHRAGGAVGASFGVALNSRVDSEFETTYADRGPGVDALAFEGRLQIALLPRDRRFVPQVTVGAAAYRADFNFEHQGMFGQFLDMRGAQFGSVPRASQRGANHGSMWGPMYGGQNIPAPSSGMPVNMTQTPQIPMFYAQRMGMVTVAADGRMPTRRFTDPAAVFGGGVTFNATRKIYVRPEARALMVIGDGDTYTVGFVTLRVGVRF